MDKLARGLVLVAYMFASLCGDAALSFPDHLDKGDDKAKGQRAWATVGTFALGIVMITLTCGYDMFVAPMAPWLFLALILLSVPASFGFFLFCERRIARGEKARSEKSQA